MRNITATFKNGQIYIHWFTDDCQGSLTVTEDQADKLCNALSFAIADKRNAESSKQLKEVFEGMRNDD